MRVARSCSGRSFAGAGNFTAKNALRGSNDRELLRIAHVLRGAEVAGLAADAELDEVARAETRARRRDRLGAAWDASASTPDASELGLERRRQRRRVGDHPLGAPLARQERIDHLALVRLAAGPASAPSTVERYGAVLWQKMQVWFQTGPACSPGRSFTITE